MRWMWANLKSGNKKSFRMEAFLLADQGSNLDSSEPKSDVLPVTPSANFVKNPIGFLLKCHKGRFLTYFFQVGLERFLMLDCNLLAFSLKNIEKK